MKVLQDFLSFTYWDFRSQFEVESERCEFSQVNLQKGIKISRDGELVMWELNQKFLNNYAYCEENAKFREFKELNGYDNEI